MREARFPSAKLSIKGRKAAAQGGEKGASVRREWLAD
jgi:hypothetical protein